MMKVKIKLSLTFLIGLLLFIPITALAQSNCESNYVSIAKVSDAVEAQKNQKSLLIIIARLGDGENRRRLNYRRLYNVRLQLNQRFAIKADKIIIAEGEPIKGLRRVEFYFNGEMIDMLLIGKNGDICVDCCDPDERFYPYKEQFEREQKQKQKKTRLKKH
jgi:hypothetical protein